jgi:hypothetical protein
MMQKKGSYPPALTLIRFTGLFTLSVNFSILRAFLMRNRGADFGATIPRTAQQCVSIEDDSDHAHKDQRTNQA